MHKMDRQKCRSLFGYCHSTHAQEQGYDVLSTTCEENKRFVIDFVQTFKTSFERGSLTKSQVLEGLDLIHDQAVDAFDALSSQLEECQTNFSKRVALRNELTDLICQLLEIETEAELVEFQRQFLKERHNEFIVSNIAYLERSA